MLDLDKEVRKTMQKIDRYNFGMVTGWVTMTLSFIFDFGAAFLAGMVILGIAGNLQMKHTTKLIMHMKRMRSYVNMMFEDMVRLADGDINKLLDLDNVNPPHDNNKDV